MCKVSFIIASMVANGAERVMSLLVNDAVAKGVEVELMLLSNNTVDYKLDERVKVYFLGENLPNGRIRASYGRFSNLRKRIKEFKPDVVVSFLTVCNIYAYFATRGLGVPVILSERNDPVRGCTGKLQRLARNISYSLSNGIIFQTEEARSCFHKRIRKKATVIPNPVKEGLPVADIENREKIVVAAGRLTEQKNYPMMLKAFSVFNRKQPEYKLHIYGDGEMKDSLQEYAQKLGLEQQVEFKGLVQDLHNRMVRAGMFVLSSDYEGISNSLLESLSMGVPCISTDCPCGGSSYLIKNGENGLLVPVGNAEKLAEAMIKVAESDEYAMKLGSAARKIREVHSAEVIIKRYFDYIQRIQSNYRRCK